MAEARQGMDVISSDGIVVGRTGAERGGGISVVPGEGGAERPLPAEWIARVDEHVHLSHSADMIRGEWHGLGHRPRASEGKARLPFVIGIVLLLVALFLLVWGIFYAAGAEEDKAPPLHEEQI